MKYLLMILLFNPAILMAQDNWDSINTDRPGEGTDSPIILPLGAVQLENGLYFQSEEDGGIKNWLMPAGLVRIGLLKNLEFRVGYGFTDQSVTINGDEISTTGFDALSLGAKIFISEQQGILPNLALITSLTLPETGAKPFQEDYLAPSIRLLAGHSINEWLGITTNIDFNWNPALTEAITGYAVSFDLSFSQKWGGYAEFYGYFPEVSASQHLFNTGLVFLLNNNLQLDTSTGFALSEDAQDYFISLGVSYRFKLF